MCLDVGEKDLDAYMQRIMAESSYSFTSSYEQETVRDIKELCYIAPNYEVKMMTEMVEMECKLLDRNIIDVGSEKFRCPVLFKPSLLGKETAGIHKVAHDSTSKCDADIRDVIDGNIYLSGGSSMFEGIKDWLHNEIRVPAPESAGKLMSSPHPVENPPPGPVQKFLLLVNSLILSPLRSTKRKTPPSYTENVPNQSEDAC